VLHVPALELAAPGLRAGELNLFDSTVVAVSSVAPAYSLAATIGFLFVAVAYAGPAVIIVSFVPVFGKVQGRFQTPMLGTLILAGVCLPGIFLRTVSPAINTGYGNLIADIGVLVAFYYGATGITCAWSYRKVMLTNTRFFFTGVLLPFLSGAFCFWVGYQVIKQSGAAASASVLVAMALGVPLIFVARLTTHSDFFRRPAIAYDSIEPSPGSVTAGLWVTAS
jgi:hypothetical protein